MQQDSLLSWIGKSKAKQADGLRPGRPYTSRASFSGTSSRQHRAPDRRRNMALKEIADETKAELPNILSQMPSFDAMDSSVFTLQELDTLDAEKCPGFVLADGEGQAGGGKGTRIQVVDMDTLDAAMELDAGYMAQTHMDMSETSKKDTTTTTASLAPVGGQPRPRRPVAVLNLASERSPGGGWQKGALAQEEALCYRSSLHLSLHQSYYPLPSLSAIYSPSVLVVRDAMSRGHALLTHAEPMANLPVTAVISVAALRYPALTHDRKRYRNAGQRAETKRKIRLTLRVAALGGHTKLVLGALGCGVFANPPKEVADCFLEVLREKEFQGGWWEDIVFAVMDNAKGDQSGKEGTGNYAEFYRVLHHQVV
ncbi:hypothetical protein ACEQ8H_001639 [Pleosporales sp. CAS-2024a]